VIFRHPKSAKWREPTKTGWKPVLKGNERGRFEPLEPPLNNLPWTVRTTPIVNRPALLLAVQEYVPS